MPSGAALPAETVVTSDPRYLLKEFRGLLDGIRLARGVVGQDQSQQTILRAKRPDRPQLELMRNVDWLSGDCAVDSPGPL